MSKEEFVAEFRHEFGGMVLDAATANRSGADLALSIRFMMKRIDAKLGQAFDLLNPPPPPPPPPQANGKPPAHAPAPTHARKQ